MLWRILNSRAGDLLAKISGSIGQRDNAMVSGGVNCGGILNVFCFIHAVACASHVKKKGDSEQVQESFGGIRNQAPVFKRWRNNC